MVEIKYKNSRAGIENGFELSFNFKKYIPEKYWQGNLFDMEKSFIFDLMEKSDLFTCDREGFDWFGINHHYCSYKEIKFTLSECDGFCSFFVEPWDITHLSEIAEALKILIIKTKE